MTMTLTENTGISSASSNKDALDLKKDAQSTSDGANFGQYLSDLFQKQADELTQPAVKMPGATTEAIGQEIAVSFASAEAAALAVTDWQLQAVTLGPNLNVITPASSAPDAQSLEAFARAQGLDEKAVHWLFGGDASQSQTLVQASPTAPNWLSMAPTSSLTWAASASNPSNAPVGTATTQAVAAVSGGFQETAPLTAQTGILAEKPANDLPKDLLGSAMLGVQALWAMPEGSKDEKKPVTPTPTSTDDVPTMQMLRMPPPAAVWMLRTAMNPAASDPQSNKHESHISLSDLDLGTDWGGDLLQELFAEEGNAAGGASGASATGTGTHGPAHANFAARWEAQVANRNDMTPNPNPAAQPPDAAARSENIQNLADKMGQAVGKRILSEMERGQWHLKLSLRPATLGHIEIEMRMRSGEFDAVFIAPNAVTRDLLQDGMNKLRETLGQMGMDVATIQVGDGRTGQSGGDSTPGFSRGKPASTEVGASETAPETKRTPSVKDPKDGLDVLV